MIIAGSILLVIALGLFGGSLMQQRKLKTLLEVPKSDVAFLTSLQDGLKKDHGKVGSLVYFTAMSGKVVCPTPLTSEFAETPCIYYKATIDREYEETVWEEDSNGDRRSRTERRSERVSKHEDRTPFFLEDATGRVGINPEGAKFTGKKVLSRYEPAQGGLNFKIGRFQVNLPAGGSRTLGYRFTEHAIPVDTAVFLHGEATDEGGTLYLRKPTDKRKFFITVKDEASLIKKAQSAIKGFRIAALIVGLVGLGLLIMSMI